MLALPRPVIYAIAAVALIAVIAIVFGLYGHSRYNAGRDQAQYAHTDSVRKILTRALDSASKAQTPVLNDLLKQNDVLKAEARKSRIEAATAIGRADRAEAALEHLPDSIRAITPPEVRVVLDSMSAASDALKVSVQHMAEKMVATEASKDSALAEAVRWRSLYGDARAALDTAAKEIGQLQDLRKPPRCGAKCGVVLGAGTTLAIIFTASKLIK